MATLTVSLVIAAISLSSTLVAGNFGVPGLPLPLPLPGLPIPGLPLPLPLPGLPLPGLPLPFPLPGLPLPFPLPLPPLPLPLPAPEPPSEPPPPVLPPPNPYQPLHVDPPLPIDPPVPLPVPPVPLPVPPVPLPVPPVPLPLPAPEPPSEPTPPVLPPPIPYQPLPLEPPLPIDPPPPIEPLPPTAEQPQTPIKICQLVNQIFVSEFSESIEILNHVLRVLNQPDPEGIKDYCTCTEGLTGPVAGALEQVLQAVASFPDYIIDKDTSIVAAYIQIADNTLGEAWEILEGYIDNAALLANGIDVDAIVAKITIGITAQQSS